MASEYEVAKAVVTLIPSMKGSQAAITKELTGSAGAAGKDAGETMGEGMSSGLSSTIGAVGKVIAGVVGGISITKLIGEVIDLGKEFTASLSNVQALSGASAEEMATLENAAKDLGRSTIFSAKEVADAFGYMSLAGWNTQEMMSGIDGVLNLAASSGMDLAKASDMVTDYLSAFGLEAQDAAGFVDMLAYAQANSNTTVDQLGEAYRNSASNMAAAGQSAETTTAILEEFANQGLKGSEAGTALSAIMRDLTQKMENGKVMIGDTAVQVQDADGNFRDLLDILEDVEGATEGMGTAQANAAQLTTFTADSLKGLNKIMQSGVDQVKDYRSELEDCNGTAEAMSDTMNDNLGGDMAALNSAMEGLGLQLFDFFEGPLREGAQAATEAINFITDGLSSIADVINPPKTELQKFIDEIRDATDAAREAAELSTKKVEDATSNIEELAAYRDILLELNEKSELTEFEQYQVKNAVEALADTIPELKDAYNETTGAIELTNEQMDDLFDNAIKAALEKALIEQQEEAFKGLADQMIEVTKAESAVETATENSSTSFEELQAKIDAIAGAGGDFYTALTADEKALYDSRIASNIANNAYKDLEETYNENGEALKDLAEKNGLVIPKIYTTADGIVMLGDEAADTTDEVEEAADAAEDLGSISAITAETIETLAEATGLSVEELQAMADSSDMTVEELEEIANGVADARNAFSDLQENVQEATKNSISYLDAFEEKTATTADAMANNLGASNTYASEWVSNMETLGQAISTMSGEEQEAFQQLYDDMLEQGPEKAGEAAKAMAQALTDNKGDFDRVVSEYGKSLDLTADSAKLAQYSSTGKAVTGEIAKGVEAGSSDVVDAAAQMTTDVTDEVDTGMEDAVSAYDGSLDAMESSTNTSANIIETRLSQMVLNLKKKMAEEIKGPTIKLPHFKLTGDFNLQTKSVPAVSVEWYAKGAIFTQPTILDTRYGFKGVGESGAEAVLPIDLLRNYIEDAVSTNRPTVNVAMTVNGAENPTMWAAQFARSLKQQMRIG